MDYIIERHMLRGRVVKFRCPNCNEPLQAPFKDAGSAQPCPFCYKKFITPGVEELRAEEAAVLARKEQKLKQIQIAKEKKELVQKVEVVRVPKEPDLVWYRQMACYGCGYRWKSRRNTPPAKCANYGGRNIVPIMEPRMAWWWPNAQGCLISVVAIGTVVVAAMAFTAYILI